MEQLYYLYNYSVEGRKYEKHIAVVRMSDTIQASLDYLKGVEDWRSMCDLSNLDSCIAEFTSNPYEIKLTYIDYTNNYGVKEYDSCIYSLEEVDMKYIGDTLC